jgi:hypothetical protein
VLLELELDSEQRANETFAAFERAGFQVRELNRTVAPRGAVEPSDPGSAGGHGKHFFLLEPKAFRRAVRGAMVPKVDLRFGHLLQKLADGNLGMGEIVDKMTGVIMYGAGLDADHPVSISHGLANDAIR